MLPIAIMRMRKPAAPATAPIDPSTKSPSALYDVSDISTLWQDTAGTSAVTTAGQSVARIDDKSGNGKHLLQSTAGSCPTYQVDGLGKPYLLFDGVDDALSVALTLTLPFDRISAIQQVAWTSARRVFAHTGGSALLLQRGSTPNLNLADVTTDIVTNTGAAVGSNAVVSERHIANASKLAVNNGAYATGDAGATAPGASLFVASSSSSGASPSNLRLYALAIKNGGFADADVPGIAAWLGAKAGLTI